jgi:hypothetical protein
MSKQFKKRPLQEAQDGKPVKAKRVKLPVKVDQGDDKEDQPQKKQQFEKKISFADMENGDAELQGKGRVRKQGRTRSDKYAPKPGPKAPEVFEKRRERRKQKSQQRKMQKASKKTAKQNRTNKGNEQVDAKAKLEQMDDLLSNTSMMSKDQINELQKLIGQLNGEEIKMFCGKVIRLISNAEIRNERVKVILIEKLGTALRSGHVVSDQTLLLRGLKFLALNAFFAAGEKAKNVCFFSERARDMFRVNLHRSVVAMFKTRGSAHLTTEEDGNSEDASKKTAYNHLVLLNQLIDYLSSLLFDTNSHFVCLQKRAKRTFEKIVTSQRKLRTELREQKDQSIGNVLNAFVTFYDLLLLLTFEDVEAVKGTFEELEQCLIHVKRELLGSDETPSNEAEETEGEQPQWADVLSDIVISYLLKPSQLVRSAVISVFSLVKEHISNEAIEQICLALISDENEEEHQDEEVKANETVEDEEQMSDMDADSVMDEDEEEKVDGEEEEEAEDEEAEDEEDDEDDEDEDEDEDMDEVDEEFRQKLKLALGKAALESGDEDEDDDVAKNDEEEAAEEDDDEMDNVDDEDMLKFDEALANVFRERKNSKKQSKNISHLEFKSRCLDLVEQLISRKSIPLSQLILLSEKLLEMNQKSLTNKTTDLVRRSSYVLCQISKVSKPTLDIKSDGFERIVKLFQTSIDLSNAVQDKGVQNHLYDFAIWCIASNSKLGLTNDWNQILNKLIERYFKSNNFKLSSTFFIRLCTLNKVRVRSS